MYQYDKKGPKRGIALYSYSAEFGISKNLEDCLEDMYDMGAQIHTLRDTRIRRMNGWRNGSGCWTNMRSCR